MTNSPRSMAIATSLAGKIQEKYGIAKEEAHKQIDEWAARLKG